MIRSQPDTSRLFRPGSCSHAQLVRAKCTYREWFDQAVPAMMSSPRRFDLDPHLTGETP
jgi:hypothetical protein